jgi:eukaryotic-like serine/threonine-protein kinase
VQAGTRVGKYRVIGPLGRGGMGGVFEVEDGAGRRFALKSPLRDIEGSAVTQRFAREANALRLVEHENLVAAVDVFVEAHQLFLVMEKVSGVALSSLLAKGRLEPRRALVIARQLLAGVGHAHAKGLVHRDLKPDHILLVAMPGGWESAKIIDFGIVKLLGDAAAAFGQHALTNTGLVVGTPAYMAPEQALGRAIDGRVDLYAIGVILYEMLTGRLPFRDPDPLVMMRLHAKAAPAPLRQVMFDAAWCTPEVVALVEGALVKNPGDRYADTAAMIAALDGAFASIDHLE